MQQIVFWYFSAEIVHVTRHHRIHSGCQIYPATDQLRMWWVVSDFLDSLMLGKILNIFNQLQVDFGGLDHQNCQSQMISSRIHCPPIVHATKESNTDLIWCSADCCLASTTNKTFSANMYFTLPVSNKSNEQTNTYHPFQSGANFGD